MAMKISLIFIVTVFSICNAALVDDYDHFAALDPDEKVKLYWTIDEEIVSFALDGATKGWVGFGVSTGQGKMDKADMVIGWVKDGKTYLSDRHGVGHYPEIDGHDDYKLISGMEDNGRTIIKFSRKIDTCDKQDLKLKEGTTKVIFALNENDPESPKSIPKHTFKGIRSILLLNNLGSRSKPDASWRHFDVLNKNYSVPTHHTTYYCSVHKIPDFKEKIHIVRFDPVVQPGNEGVVHHLVIVVCDPKFPEQHVNFSGSCDDRENMPQEVQKCHGLGLMIAVWGIGGGAFVYPKDIGFPLGVEFTGRHFVMEIHYDNLGQKPGFVDNSGIRFYYPKKLRKHDAGVLTVGSAVSSWMMIPPQQKRWRTTSYCGHCIEKALKNSSLPGGGIKFFSSFLHTHLTGVALWTKHVRNGEELPEIARDDNYDFNFQDIQFMNKEVHFKPGDDLIHTCVFDTTKRNRVTYGGPSTSQEMCLNFLFYYPLIPNLDPVCLSLDLRPAEAIMNKYYPETQVKFRSVWWNAIMISKKNWTKEMTDDYRKMIDDEKGYYVTYPFCNNNNMSISLKDAVKDKYQIPIPKITTTLPKPIDQCKAKDVDSSATKLAGWVWFSQAIALFVMTLLC